MQKSRGMLAPVITVKPIAKEVNAAIRVAEENKGLVKAFKIRLGYVKASAGPCFLGCHYCSDLAFRYESWGLDPYPVAWFEFLHFSTSPLGANFLPERTVYSAC